MTIKRRTLIKSFFIIKKNSYIFILYPFKSLRCKWNWQELQIEIFSFFINICSRAIVKQLLISICFENILLVNYANISVFEFNFANNELFNN